MRHAISLVALLALFPACDDASKEVDDSGDTDPDANLDDVDGDGVVAAEDCDDEDTSIGGPTTVWTDADSDGYGDPATNVAACDAPVGSVAEGTDCDDTDASVHPGAAEVCDALDVDEDCNGAADDADDAATGSTGWFVDADADGYGVDTAGMVACDRPDGYSATAGDCDDADAAYNPAADESDCTDPADYNCDGSVVYADADGDGYAACAECDDAVAAVNPSAAEICDAGDVDEDCDGLVDDADDSVAGQVTSYVDADGDGFGDDASPGVAACDLPSGSAAVVGDCDDTRSDVNPDAIERCNAFDDDCDGIVAEGGSLGSGSACAGLSCLDVLLGESESADGLYWLDPDGDGLDAAQLYCDMTSADGGWTLISWTGDSTVAPLGVPYPGLATCPSQDCARGSAAETDLLNDLLEVSAEIGLGHSTTAIGSHQGLAEYTYAGYYDYGSLAGLYLDPGTGTSVACDTAGFGTGTFHVVSGPTTYEGTTTYLAQSFRYSTTGGYNDYNESSAYIWNLGADSYCGGSGAAPGAWLGNWSSSESEYGPYLAGTAGARAVWLR
ncbi:MAG: MopE-related protein [Pseudomonadota bacterium]|nr:MopE-related protein [Pseudomonadota bacterium]